jgi:hypothetical protein
LAVHLEDNLGHAGERWLRRNAAAPAIVGPLRFLQIIEIAAAYFRVWIHETGFAVQSMLIQAL